jgi:DNA-binding transcriptional LysR family regulator
MTNQKKLNRFKYIEAFLEVVNTGSISLAAKHLNVSQPAVSQLIKKLEESVGVPLFVRRNGMIFPTNRAESLRDDAKQLLLLLDKIQMQLNFGKTNYLDTLRLSASLSVMNEILPKVITKLHSFNPKMTIYTNTLPISSMSDALIGGNIDFAFSSRKIDHPNIISKKILSAKEVCVLPTKHELAKKKKLSITDINNQKLLMTSRTDRSYYFHREILQKHNILYQKILETSFSTLSMSVIESLNALSINNVLIAELVANHNRGITWRYIDQFIYETDFYLSMPPWLNKSNTESIVLKSIKQSLKRTLDKLQIQLKV